VTVAKLKPESTETAPNTTPEKITQRQAVERALAAGKDLPSEGVSFVKDTFGMTLSNQAFSTLKSQIKSGARKPARTQSKSVASPAVATPSTNGKHRGDAVELARAVKQLVQQHGAEAVAEMAKVFAD
jgi:hypothetical protein